MITTRTPVTPAEAIAGGIAEETKTEYIAQHHHAATIAEALTHQPGTEERKELDDIARIHARRKERARTARHALTKAACAAAILTEEEIIAAWREGKHRAGVTPYTVGPDTSTPD